LKNNQVVEFRFFLSIRESESKQTTIITIYKEEEKKKKIKEFDFFIEISLPEWLNYLTL